MRQGIPLRAPELNVNSPLMWKTHSARVALPAFQGRPGIRAWPASSARAQGNQKSVTVHLSFFHFILYYR